MGFHLDENISGVIARGLRLHGIDVTTAAEAGLAGAADADHIAYSDTNGRVVVTHDDDFLTLAATTPHPGVAYCRQGSRTNGEIIRYLMLMHGCMTADEMRDHIEFL